MAEPKPVNLNRFVPAEEELTGTAPASPSHSSEHFDFERNGLLNAPDPIARLLRLTRELFTASHAPIDARRGLPDLRSAWREAGGSELCVPIRKEGVMP